MKDFSSDLGELRRRLSEAAQYLNIETSRGLLVELEGEVAKPDLWNDQEHAKKVNSQYAALKADIDQFNSLTATVDDLFILHELARAEDDATQEPELEKAKSILSNLQDRFPNNLPPIILLHGPLEESTMYALRNATLISKNNQSIMAVPSRVEVNFAETSISTNLASLGMCCISPPVLRASEIDNFVYEDFFCVSSNATISNYFCRFGEFVAKRILDKKREREAPTTKLGSIYSGLGKGILLLDRYRKNKKLSVMQARSQMQVHNSEQMSNDSSSIPAFLSKQN
jgi:hypothetical protein